MRRTIINLPASFIPLLKRAVNEGYYRSYSDFIRHLLYDEFKKRGYLKGDKK